MDFSFTEEQEAVAQAAASVFDGMVTPARVAEIERTDDRVDDQLWAALARSNLLGLAVPEEQGGSGLGLTEVCLVLEQQGRTVAPVPLWATTVLGALPLARWGSPAHKGTGATLRPCCSRTRQTSVSPRPDPPWSSGTARPSRLDRASAAHNSSSTRSSVASISATRAGVTMPSKTLAAAWATASCSSVKEKSTEILVRSVGTWEGSTRHRRPRTPRPPACRCARRRPPRR